MSRVVVGLSRALRVLLTVTVLRPKTLCSSCDPWLVVVWWLLKAPTYSSMKNYCAEATLIQLDNIQLVLNSVLI